MVPLTETERAVYYPQDRRFRFWVRPAALLLVIVLALVPLVFAWLQRAFWGLPYIAPNPASASGAASGPHRFPVWIRWCHAFNLFFTFMLIRSGFTPGTEWIRLTPLKVPTDRIWTAKDDNRYISPLFGLPGQRVLFTTAMDMLNHLNASQVDHSLVRKLRVYTEPALLIVDKCEVVRNVELPREGPANRGLPGFPPPHSFAKTSKHRSRAGVTGMV